MSDKSPENPDFEHALSELETLVQKLESGELTLDQSLTEFRKGVELTRRCQAVLDKAQLTVEQLLDIDDESSASDFKPGD
ncbi:exodeoxyribonuclease VII small subunit [Marinihelvus fidelis]|uniref:Exodeoxyribonuclease 7 small subunit n=1 Tax=Marinihelvus fidelis TaxID=2613842 RepID=A0A5N0TF35_9GAMM|nr:exodeoxyribonuclease VII small subunit [Marinihelvus fidelis]KAA9131869.1 exodeoxyribonuclease VII small subunit [Marinihelvus fidelis]